MSYFSLTAKMVLISVSHPTEAWGTVLYASGIHFHYVSIPFPYSLKYYTEFNFPFPL